MRAFLKTYTNAWTVAAAVAVVLGTGPLVIGGLLDTLGFVDIGTGLGFGLLHIVTLPVAVICFAMGLVRANARPRTTTPR